MASEPITNYAVRGIRESGWGLVVETSLKYKQHAAFV